MGSHANKITLQNLVRYIESIKDHDPNADIVDDNVIDDKNENVIGNVTKISSLMPQLTDALGDHFDGIGKVRVEHLLRIGNNVVDVSLLASLLVALLPKMRVMEGDKRMESIKNMMSSILIDLETTSMYTDMGYNTTGIKKQTLLTSIRESDSSPSVIMHLSNYFFINIIVIDNDEDEISLYYSGNVFDRHRRTVMIHQELGYMSPMIIKGKYSLDDSPLLDIILDAPCTRAYPGKTIAEGDIDLSVFVANMTKTYNGQLVGIKNNYAEVTKKAYSDTIPDITDVSDAESDADADSDTDNEEVFVKVKGKNAAYNSSSTVKGLKAAARAAGIKGYSTMTKDKLIAALNAL